MKLNRTNQNQGLPVRRDYEAVLLLRGRSISFYVAFWEVRNTNPPQIEIFGIGIHWTSVKARRGPHVFDDGRSFNHAHPQAGA